MKYPSGEVVKVGDLVELWPGCHGEVVCSIDSRSYTPMLPESEWGYLKQGVLVKSDQAELIHYIEPETKMRLLKRTAVRE